MWELLRVILQLQLFQHRFSLDDARHLKEAVERELFFVRLLLKIERVLGKRFDL